MDLSHIQTNLPDIIFSYDTFKKEVKDLVLRAKQLCERALKEYKLDISDINEVLLVGGSCRMRVIKEMLQEVFPNQALKESINPDEAVAYGATIRAAQILDEHQVNEMLLEKLPIGIGVELLEDRYQIVLKRNTPIPSPAIEKTYTTSHNDQSSIMFTVSYLILLFINYSEYEVRD